MNQALFLRIVDVVIAHNSYFVQKRNDVGCTSWFSISSKVTVVFQLLAYGVPTNYVDEYVQLLKALLLKASKDLL